MRLHPLGYSGLEASFTGLQPALSCLLSMRQFKYVHVQELRELRVSEKKKEVTLTLYLNRVSISTVDSPKPLLACSVPDLQFDLLTRDFYYSSAKLDTNRVRAISHNYMRKEEVKEGGTSGEGDGGKWKEEGRKGGRKGEKEEGREERRVTSKYARTKLNKFTYA